jgi:hypothetical protein
VDVDLPTESAIPESSSGSLHSSCSPCDVMAPPSTRLDVPRLSGTKASKAALRRSVLHRYTLNSGAVSELHRQPLSRRTSNTLWELIERGGGPFAGILSAFACRVEPGIEAGGRTFWILRKEDPMFLGVVCWDASCGGEQFGIAERTYFDLFLQECFQPPTPQPRSPGHAPAPPTRVPWLARVLFPVFHQLDPRETLVLDELERCLAWTLLTRSVVPR